MLRICLPQPITDNSHAASNHHNGIIILQIIDINECTNIKNFYLSVKI